MIDGRPLLPAPGSSDPWGDTARGLGECEDPSVVSTDVLGLKFSFERAALRFLFLESASTCPPPASCCVRGFFCALLALSATGKAGTSSPDASWRVEEARERAAGDEAAELSVERPRFLRPLGGWLFFLVREEGRRGCGGLPGRHHRSISALLSRTSSTQHGGCTASSRRGSLTSAVLTAGAGGPLSCVAT